MDNLQKSQIGVITESPPPPKSQNGKRIACLAQEAGHPASAQEEVGEEEAANGGGVKGQQLWQGQGENRSEYLMKIYLNI